MVFIRSPAGFLNMIGLREGQTHRYSSSFWVGFRHYFLSFIFIFFFLKVPWLILGLSLAENCHAKTDEKHSSYRMRILVFAFVRGISQAKVGTSSLADPWNVFGTVRGLQNPDEGSCVRDREVSWGREGKAKAGVVPLLQ